MKRKNVTILTFLILFLCLEAVWIFFVLPAQESDTQYTITQTTPASLNAHPTDQNVFSSVSSTFSFNYPLEWTVTTTSEFSPTTTDWFFMNENKQVAELHSPAYETAFGSCSTNYIYRHSFRTNDPNTFVVGEVCASCKNENASPDNCKLSDKPSVGYIYWHKGSILKKQSDIPAAIQNFSLMLIQFSDSDMNMDQAVGTVEQIASSVTVE